MQKMKIDDGQKNSCTWDMVADITEDKIGTSAPIVVSDQFEEVSIWSHNSGIQRGQWSYVCQYFIKTHPDLSCQSLYISKLTTDLEDLPWFKRLLQTNPLKVNISGPWSSAATTFLLSAPHNILQGLRVCIKADVDTEVYKPFLEKLPYPIHLEWRQKGVLSISESGFELLENAKIGMLTVDFVDAPLPTSDNLIHIGNAIKKNHNICGIALDLQGYDDNSRLLTFLTSALQNKSIKSIDISIKDTAKKTAKTNNTGAPLLQSLRQDFPSLQVSTRMSAQYGSGRCLALDCGVSSIKAFSNMHAALSQQYDNRNDKDCTDRKKIHTVMYYLKRCMSFLPLSDFANSEWFVDGRWYSSYEIQRNEALDIRKYMGALWVAYYTPLNYVKGEGSTGVAHVLDLPVGILQHIMSFVPMESVLFEK